MLLGFVKTVISSRHKMEDYSLDRNKMAEIGEHDQNIDYDER